MERKYIVIIIFIILLLYGPIGQKPYISLIIRIGYLILVPLISWLGLKWLWRYLRPNKLLEEKLSRSLVSATSGIFFILALNVVNQNIHIENSITIRTHFGLEDVGEYLTTPGVDWGAVIILVVLGIISFWYSVTDWNSKEKS